MIGWILFIPILNLLDYVNGILNADFRKDYIEFQNAFQDYVDK